MPEIDSQQKGQANPLIWGAIGAVIVALGGTFLRLFPEIETSGNLSTMSLGALVAAGFFWGWAAGMVKNWLGRRR